MPRGVYVRKPFTKEHRRSLSESHKDIRQSQETIEKRVSKLRNEKSINWKGNKVSYRGAHVWVERHKGKPDTCSECGKSGLFGRQIAWANVDHKYRRVLTDYIRLCRKCHEEFDKNIK